MTLLSRVMAATSGGHAPELIRGIEDAILEVASRPRGLRGPFLIDDAHIEAQARAIIHRRAALLTATEGAGND